MSNSREGCPVIGRNSVGILALWLITGIAACGNPRPPASISGSPISGAPVPGAAVSGESTSGAPSTSAGRGSASAYRPNNPDPVSAVESFLIAEIDGDFEASFSLLSKADQAAAGDLAGWVAEHYLVIPTIRGFRLTADSADGTRAEVQAGLSLEAGLDQLVGLTPEKAESTWVLFEEAGEWRISFTQSGIDPVYLDDASAPVAVERWVLRRQNCEPAADWDASLLGFPSLVGTLCGSEGAIRAGIPVPLADAAESAPFLAAFGPDVGRWARVVPVDGAHPFRAVIAPIGNEWVVIGVLEA